MNNIPVPPVHRPRLEPQMNNINRFSEAFDAMIDVGQQNILILLIPLDIILAILILVLAPTISGKDLVILYIIYRMTVYWYNLEPRARKK